MTTRIDLLPFLQDNLGPSQDPTELVGDDGILPLLHADDLSRSGSLSVKGAPMLDERLLECERDL